jgi:hypothetical protein
MRTSYATGTASHAFGSVRGVFHFVQRNTQTFGELDGIIVRPKMHEK